MSQFQDAQADPKKQFLSMLVKEHFNLGQAVWTSQIGNRTPVILQLHNLTTIIKELLPETDKNQTQQLRTQIETLLCTRALIAQPDILKMYETLTNVITRNFYADLNFNGLIPASITAGQTDRPTNTPANPNRTSRI